jgi:hypothetical protein
MSFLHWTEWQRAVVGVLTNLEAQFLKGDNGVIKRAADILYHQLSFCQHIRVPATLIELTKKDCTNLANFFYNKLSMTVKNQYTVPYFQCDKVYRPASSFPFVSVNFSGVRFEDTMYLVLAKAE